MKRILSVVLFGLLLVPVAWAPNTAADDAVVEAQAAEGALGLTREQRRQIQEGLAARGFDVGPADGSFGPRTREAIRAWQHGYMSGRDGATGYLSTSQAQSLLGGNRVATRPRQSSGGVRADGPTYEETWEWLRGYLGKIGDLEVNWVYRPWKSSLRERFDEYDSGGDRVGKRWHRFYLFQWSDQQEIGDFQLNQKHVSSDRYDNWEFHLTSVRLVRHQQFDRRLIEFVCLEEFGDCIHEDNDHHRPRTYLLGGDGVSAERIWKALSHMQRLAEESKGGTDLF